MNASNLSDMEQRLTDIAEALGGRAPTKGALRVWHDTLRDQSYDDVVAVLADWARDHVKPPTPAEVARAVGGRVSDRIERTAALHARENRRTDLPAGDPNSPGYRAFREAMQRLRHRQHHDPRDWARRLRDREAAGEHLSIVQSSAWRTALGVTAVAAVERAETDDEREARIEREAIEWEDVVL